MPSCVRIARASEREGESVHIANKGQRKQQQERHTKRHSPAFFLSFLLNPGWVKDIMNGCYQQLCEQITDPHVLRIIAQTIKRETKAALERAGGQ